MGLETAAIVMATVAVGAEVGKSVAQVQVSKQQDKALELQALQQELQTQQKTLSNYDVMEKVLDAQIAHQTITGTAFSSPSFNAVQRETLNIGSRKQRNIDIEGELAQENIALERKNVRTSLYAQLFGNAANAAMAGFSVYSKMPQLQE
jgi:hypothetical protein